MIEITEGKITDCSLKIGDYIVNYDKATKKPILDKNGILRKVKYKDLTGAEIELLEGLTPVKYNGTSWIVADTSQKWYDYANQEWANAVILESGITKNIGDTVDVTSEVKAMFVYIPRYEYKIEGEYGKGGTSATSPGEIEINFLSKNTTTANEGYTTHPAFTFGNDELNGIWVGKFETTGTGDNPTILPSVTSLRNQNINTQFVTAQKFNAYITNGDSHMMKNSEWGAVAYLSQSKFGKYGNSKYVGAEKEVMINNCSNYITGIGADSLNDGESTSTCTTNTYETEKGQAASTTGNVTGVYDMSGGAWEYVMGYLSGASSTWGATLSNNDAGFTSAPEEKYYDIYTSTDISSNDKELSKTACSEGICYGHALSETSRWYVDHAGFVYSSAPWFLRGGYCNGASGVGVFASGHSGGYAYDNFSFRVVFVQTTK